ncbi:MAG: hypothetical protein MJK04_19255, partial [Psychrosphaera sp.]|nr:hypothetical protein [Psychrosphaera sp.]
LNALDNRFDYHRLAGLDASEYLTRVISYASVKNSSLLEKGAVLISYQIDEASASHTCRFMLEGREIPAPDETQVSMVIEREITLTIDSQLQITRSA